MVDNPVGVSDILRRCQIDTSFLALLLSDPSRALEGMDVAPEIRQSLATNSATRLLSLTHMGIIQSGCGSHGTCSYTCLVTELS